MAPKTKAEIEAAKAEAIAAGKALKEKLSSQQANTKALEALNKTLGSSTSPPGSGNLPADLLGGGGERVGGGPIDVNVTGMSSGVTDTIRLAAASAVTAKMMGGRADMLKPDGSKQLAKDAVGFGASLSNQEPALTEMTDKWYEFNKAQGFAKTNFDNFAKGVKPMREELSKLNIPMSKVIDVQTKLASSEGPQALRKLFRMQGKEAKEAATSIAAMGAVFVKAGGTTETFGKALNTLGFDYGKFNKGGKAAKEAVKELMDGAINLSSKLNMPLDQTVKNLTSNFPDMVTLGLKPMIRNMSELTTASENSGIGLQSLVNAAKGMETYEGAADVVGNLAAVMKGTTLSVAELVSAEPAERVKLVMKDIKEGIKSGRVELAEGGMKRVHQIQAMADAAKITPAEMNRLLTSKQTVDEMFTVPPGKKDDRKSLKEKMKENLGGTDVAGAPMTGFKNRIVSDPKEYNDFSKKIRSDAAIMAKNLKPLNRGLKGIVGQMSAIKAASKVFESEGTPDSGFLGQILFGRGEVINDNVKAVTAMLKKVEELTDSAVKKQIASLKDSAPGGPSLQGGESTSPGLPGYPSNTPASPASPGDPTAAGATGAASPGDPTAAGTPKWEATPDGGLRVTHTIHTSSEVPADLLREQVNNQLTAGMK